MSKSKTTTIKEYYTKLGKKHYMFKIYLGINPLTGKPNSTTRRFKTLPEAKRALTQMKFEIQNGTYHRQQVDTYQEVYNLWIKQYEKNVEESTFVKTTSVFHNHILPAMGNYRITKMNFSVCQKHVNEWADKLKKARIVKSYASKVLDFAIKIGYIQTNPFALVEVPSSSKSTLYGEESEKSYTKEQLITFLQCMRQELNTKAYTLFHLLAYSGMRKSEALALTWKDIDFITNEIRINKALGRGKENKLYIKPPKTGNPRTIKIDSTTISILKEWKKQQRQNYLILGYNTMQPKQLVFSNMKNEFLQPTVTNKWLKNVLTKYKLADITTHGFRHTHCSLLLEANVRPKEVSDRLGHRDTHTTLNIYAHVSEQAKNDTVNKFEIFMTM